MIEIRLTTGQPEYIQIVEQIRLAIAGGRLASGEQLTPVRELAAQIGVNPSTVARAYRALDLAGIVEAHGRRGTRVTAERDQAALAGLREARLRALIEHAVIEALAQGFSADEIEAAYGLQLAAWREQRKQQIPARMPANTDRLFRFAGSHDLALETLWAHVARGAPLQGAPAHDVLEHGRATHARITPSYVGSLDGLLALLHGDVALAGTHLLDEETGEYNLPILRRLFPGGQVCLITLAERDQGLIVATGNPRGIRGLDDLVLSAVRYVNRQPGSGTRALIDHELRRRSIATSDITGYERVATTHMAVAAAVAEGSADAGLGLYAAARAFGLDFIPVARERYDLVCYAADRHQAPLNGLFERLSSPAFKRVIAELGGYHTEHTGEASLVR